MRRCRLLPPLQLGRAFSLHGSDVITSSRTRKVATEKSDSASSSSSLSAQLPSRRRRRPHPPLRHPSALARCSTSLAGSSRPPDCAKRTSPAARGPPLHPPPHQLATPDPLLLFAIDMDDIVGGSAAEQSTTSLSTIAAQGPTSESRASEVPAGSSSGEDGSAPLDQASLDEGRRAPGREEMQVRHSPWVNPAECLADSAPALTSRPLRPRPALRLNIALSSTRLQLNSDTRTTTSRCVKSPQDCSRARS